MCWVQPGTAAGCSSLSRVPSPTPSLHPHCCHRRMEKDLSFRYYQQQLDTPSHCRRVTLVNSHQVTLRNKDLSSYSVSSAAILQGEDNLLYMLGRICFNLKLKITALETKWKTVRLQTSFSHTTSGWLYVVRLAAQDCDSLKPDVLVKPTLKGKSWCLKVLSIVNHLTGSKYCSH